MRPLPLARAAGLALQCRTASAHRRTLTSSTLGAWGDDYVDKAVPPPAGTGAGAAAPHAPAKLPLLRPARVQRLLSFFPPVEYGFAYGSGAFEQPDLYPKQEAVKATAATTAPTKTGGPPTPLLDLIFAVDDPRAWHAANLGANPSHYSGVSRHLLGPEGVEWVARNVGAAVHFNTLVRLEGAGGSGSGAFANSNNNSDEDDTLRVKYGVVGTSDLVEDLLTWRHLYIAGRLHKPVAPLTLAPASWPLPAAAGGGEAGSGSSSSSSSKLDAALAANLRAAVHTALLLSPETFTLRVSKKRNPRPTCRWRRPRPHAPLSPPAPQTQKKHRTCSAASRP